MSIYHYSGTLVDGIAEENIGKAQAYLTSDNMTQYIPDSVKPVVEFVEWRLASDGYEYKVLMVTSRDLTDEEIEVMRDWVSGQNSDGLGESFEQQNWAWIEDEVDCDDCSPYACECGYAAESGHMCSFDWEKNESTFVQMMPPQI